MQEDKLIYKIIFEQQERIYEIYAKHISEGALMGFIEVEALIFTDHKHSAVIDPSEERLRAEFAGVPRSYIPLHAILRIDEVQKEGVPKIEKAHSSQKIKKFPSKHRSLSDEPPEGG